MNHIAKIVLISKKKIMQNGIHNFILILFVAASVFFMNLSLSTFRYCMYQSNLIKNCGLYDSYMYVGTPTKQIYYADSDGDMMQKAEEYVETELLRIEAANEIEKVFPVYEYGSVLDERPSKETRLFYADYELLRELYFPVQKGCWFHAYAYQKDAGAPVPVVVGHHLKRIFRVGHQYTFGSQDETYVVVGVLKPNARFLHSGAGGNGIDLNAVMQDADDMIVVAQKPEDHNSYIVRLPEKNSGEAEKKVYGSVADITDTFSFQYLAEEAYQSNLFSWEMQTTLSVMVLLVCIIGMGCENLMSFVKGKRRQAVYFLCGMNKKTGMLVFLAEGIFKLFIPALIGFGMFLAYCGTGDYDALFVDGFNLICTAAVICAVFWWTWIRTIQIEKNHDVLRIIQS